jgi:uncharacterized protein YkwD
MSPRHSHHPLNRPLSHVLDRPLRPLQAILLACALCLGAAVLAAPASAARARARGERASHMVCHTRATHKRRACARLARVRNERRRHHRATAPRVAAPTATPAQSEANNAAVIASVLAEGCENTTLTPEAGNLPEIDAATLCLINQERARNDELPLRLNADLQEAANEHSREMVEKDYFAHVSPSGMTPLERVRATGYIPSPQDGYTIGENIAWGTLELSTPQAIVKAWIASPEHLANILESHYTDTAIGVAPAAPASLANGQQGAVYSQEFGVIVQ